MKFLLLEMNIFFLQNIMNKKNTKKIILTLFLAANIELDLFGNDLVNKHINITNSIIEIKKYNTKSLNDPVIIMDPYNLSPLTGLIIFTSKKSINNIEISINNKNKCSFEYNIKTQGKKHHVPIIGLKQGLNHVIIKAKYFENVIIENSIKLITDKLQKFPNLLIKKQFDNCKNKIILVSPTLPNP